MVLKQYLSITFYRILMRNNVLTKHLLLFVASDIICYDDHLIFSFICQKRQQPFSEIVLEFRLNIYCQGSTLLISIFLSLAEFLFLLTSGNIQPEVKTYQATPTKIYRCLIFLMQFSSSKKKR